MTTRQPLGFRVEELGLLSTVSEDAMQNFLLGGESLPVIIICKLVMFVSSSSSTPLQIYSRLSYSENEGVASHLTSSIAKVGSPFNFLDQGLV